MQKGYNDAWPMLMRYIICLLTSNCGRNPRLVQLPIMKEFFQEEPLRGYNPAKKYWIIRIKTHF